MLLFLSLFAIILAEDCVDKPNWGCDTIEKPEYCNGMQMKKCKKACDQCGGTDEAKPANECTETFEPVCTVCADWEDCQGQRYKIMTKGAGSKGPFGCMYTKEYTYKNDKTDGDGCPPYCTSCTCYGWDGKNYSNCRETTKDRACDGYCVSCEMDGKTPMKGLYTTHKQECAKYEEREEGVASVASSGGTRCGRRRHWSPLVNRCVSDFTEEGVASVASSGSTSCGRRRHWSPRANACVSDFTETESAVGAALMVTVKDLGGNVNRDFTLDSSASVLALMKEIEAKDGVPTSLQRLIYLGTQLDTWQILGETVADKGTVVLMVRSEEGVASVASSGSTSCGRRRHWSPRANACVSDFTETAVGIDTCEDDEDKVKEDTYDPKATCEWVIGKYNSYGIDLCAPDSTFSTTCCATCSAQANKAVAAVMPSSQENLVVYAFAAIGLGALVFGSYKHYCAKTEEAMPINVL